MDEAEMRRAIVRKREGEELDDATWRRVVSGAVAQRIDEAQLAALLMACVWRGLSASETRALTEAFVESGERLDAPPRTVDKHSSGGVADTASLIVVPLVAACGIPVAKLSGRALGHTGGTLDKLEAIEAVRTDLDPERFFAVVREAGCAIAAQGPRLVPADKRLYALRDRTGTVPSPGLIAASIVAKKIAGGAHAIVYDVKVGNGAFVRTLPEARELARVLVTLTRSFGRNARAVVSDMDEPLGPRIGTGLEAIEAREYLNGTRRDPRLHELCMRLATALLEMTGTPAGDARARLETVLTSGAAYATFERMLALQGARSGALGALRPHRVRTPVSAEHSGFVARFDTLALGELARDLTTRSGALAGLEIHVRTGDYLRAGEPLATIYGDASGTTAVRATIVVSDEPPLSRPLVACELDADGDRSTDASK